MKEKRNSSDRREKERKNEWKNRRKEIEERFAAVSPARQVPVFPGLVHRREREPWASHPQPSTAHCKPREKFLGAYWVFDRVSIISTLLHSPSYFSFFLSSSAFSSHGTRVHTNAHTQRERDGEGEQNRLKEKEVEEKRDWKAVWRDTWRYKNWRGVSGNEVAF